jgi:hypothetical protein
MGSEVNIRFTLGELDQTGSGSCAVANFGFTNGKPSSSAASACLHFVYLLYKFLKSTLDSDFTSSLF